MLACDPSVVMDMAKFGGSGGGGGKAAGSAALFCRELADVKIVAVGSFVRTGVFVPPRHWIKPPAKL